MLECQSVSRRFGDVIAVDDVSFRVDSGQIIGLLGHNGAGKTTIMRMITGALEPSSGRIFWDGQDLQTHALALHSAIGYLPEQLPVYPEMTLIEYLDYCAALRGLQTVEARRQAVRRVVADTQLEPKLFSRIQTLSRGYKQRVGVAQALLTEPRLVVLDEPTNGLDPEQTQHMRELIQRLGKTATVILSTHIMQEVQAVCDRVLMVQQGQLTLDASLAQLSEQRRLDVRCADVERARAQLSGLAGIARIEVSGERLSLTLNEATERDALAAEVSRRLVQAGVDLYGLHSEQQDLERLFFAGRNAQKETAHVA
ncbi:ABC transporter ATP-binding protein [Saccharospirillum mangrovi]|uniref:ABC transporter ATP-binding protein n=1 Tax=Saccharospirillum mangrovi TaxID=2161747 RepID=UPI000D3876BE|nr:ABC transporter ATP-binding protein [Saccharospirillum mangrovi]